MMAAVLAACAPDAPSADAEPRADSAAVAAEGYVEPRLTPAESAAAVARIRAHGDSMTRAVRGPDAAVSPPHVETPQKQYDNCLRQARSVDEPVRSTILQACERFRQPQPETAP